MIHERLFVYVANGDGTLSMCEHESDGESFFAHVMGLRKNDTVKVGRQTLVFSNQSVYPLVRIDISETAYYLSKCELPQRTYTVD